MPGGSAGRKRPSTSPGRRWNIRSWLIRCRVPAKHPTINGRWWDSSSAHRQLPFDRRTCLDTCLAQTAKSPAVLRPASLGPRFGHRPHRRQSGRRQRRRSVLRSRRGSSPAGSSIAAAGSTSACIPGTRPSRWTRPFGGGGWNRPCSCGACWATTRPRAPRDWSSAKATG